MAIYTLVFTESPEGMLAMNLFIFKQLRFNEIQDSSFLECNCFEGHKVILTYILANALSCSSHAHLLFCSRCVRNNLRKCI